MGQLSRSAIEKLYTAKLTSAKTVLFSRAQRQAKTETQSDGHPILGHAKLTIQEHYQFYDNQGKHTKGQKVLR